MNAHFRIGRKYNFGTAWTPFYYGNHQSSFTYVGFLKKSGCGSKGQYVFKDKDGCKQYVSRLNSGFVDMLRCKLEVKNG